MIGPRDLRSDGLGEAAAPFLGFGMKRSMNAGAEPAGDWKSGSLRILRCSGIDVLMPSMTVISSVRRMRAIASGGRGRGR